MGKIKEILAHCDCICLDSSPFIYFIEQDPKYVASIRQIFYEITYGNIMGVSSYLSLLEVLVKPMKEGALEIAAKYKNLMLSSASLKLFPLDDKVAETAAELRARYKGNGFKLKTPDAIQIATGIINNADIFLTNDIHLKQVKDIKIVVLDDVIGVT